MKLDIKNMCVVAGKNKYQISFDEINIGDQVYNPLSDVLIHIDEDDNIEYVNNNYFKIC
jgi:hypothetical protein